MSSKQNEKETEEDQVKQAMILLLLQGKTCQLCGETEEVQLDLYVNNKRLKPKSFKTPASLCKQMKKSNIFCVTCFRKSET